MHYGLAEFNNYNNRQSKNKRHRLFVTEELCLIMKNDIYITRHIDLIQKDIVIEGDEHSIWAYLLDSENNIVLDGFVCSRGTIVDSTTLVKDFIDKGFAPPLSKDFKNDFSIQSDLNSADISIKVNKRVIEVLIFDEVYLTMDYMNLKSHSKSISKSGAYGLPLN